MFELRMSPWNTSGLSRSMCARPRLASTAVRSRSCHERGCSREWSLEKALPFGSSSYTTARRPLPRLSLANPISMAMLGWWHRASKRTSSSKADAKPLPLLLCSTFAATGSPSSSTPRKTVPEPPLPTTLASAKPPVALTSSSHRYSSVTSHSSMPGLPGWSASKRKVCSRSTSSQRMPKRSNPRSAASSSPWRPGAAPGADADGVPQHMMPLRVRGSSLKRLLLAPHWWPPSSGLSSSSTTVGPQHVAGSHGGGDGGAHSSSSSWRRAASMRSEASCHAERSTETAPSMCERLVAAAVIKPARLDKQCP
mmetsp:Transcript_33201/g.94864  ORF Transcript_33201/g.94864 Transcript_33201/m.94864 type:complete len:310 (+) Transcript_33201:219-1148(+)